MNLGSMDETTLTRLAQAVVALVRDSEAAPLQTLADLFHQSGCTTQALELARLGIARFPEDASLALHAARLLADAQDTAGAVSALEQCLKQDARNTEALWLSATLERRLGHAEKACLRLERLLEIQPGHGEGRQLLQTLRAETAKPAPVAAAKRSITTPTLAEIYVKQGYLNKAISVYTDILRDDPGNTLIQRRLVELQEALAPLPVAQAPCLQETAVQGAAEVAAEFVPPQVVQTPAPALTQTLVVAEKLPAESPAKPSLLDVLENWLQAIACRREHVR